MRRGQVPLPTIRPGGAALLVGSLACAARCAAADCVPAPSAPLISSVPLLIVTTTVPRVVGFMLLDHETQWLPSQLRPRLHGPGRVDEFPDYVYLQVVMHVTLGLGDLLPSGSIRLLVGTRALAGFALIPWSAAFAFPDMERFRRDGTERQHRAACGADRGRAAGR